MRESDAPFRILCLGDFSARSSGSLVAVDRDALDDVVARLQPELRLDRPVDVTLALTSLEDFHPDRLFQRVDVFEAFRTVRRRLHDPDGFRAAAAEVRRWMGSAEPDPSGEVVRDLLAGGGRRVREAAAGDEWAAFLRHIVAPHLVARDDPERPQLVAAVDRASAALMRAILHHPRFQALESTWRALDFLVRRLETDADLQLHLLDLPRAALGAALEGSDQARGRWLHRLLVDDATTPGAVPWALMVGDYTFDATTDDVAVLGALARTAREAGAPFIAAASPRLLEVDALHATPDPHDWRRPDDARRERWQQLRASPDAAWLGLALPRFLLRLPYGREGERLESFEFEELSPGVPHDEYLWGNPAFACACVLGQAFSEAGWRLRPRAAEISDLPLPVEEKDGERRTKPCAETLLTLEAAEIILERGLMPLLSFRDRDMVRLARLQSLRDPLTHLAGRWHA